MSLTDMKRISWKKWIILGCAFIEIVLFSGLMFGWGSLVYVLKDEGIYAHLCVNSDEHLNNNKTETSTPFADLINQRNTTGLPRSITVFMSSPPSSTLQTEVSMKQMSGSVENICKPQDEKLALCFAIASGLMCIMAAGLGHVNYKFGTRIYRLIGFTTFSCGGLMLAFVNQDVPWLIFPGLPLIAIGGLILLVSNTQIANLFERGRSTIVVCLNGAYIISSGIQLLVKLLHEHGWSRQKTYIAIVILHVLTLVSTFGYLPKTFIAPFEETVMETAPKEVTSDELVQEQNTNRTKQKQSGQESKTSDQKSGLLKYLRQPLFVTHCVWFCILQLKFFYFTGILNMYLNRILDADKERVSYFTNIWIYVMMGGALPASILVGSIYDWQKRKYSEHSATSKALMPAVIPHTLASLVFVLFNIATLIPSESLMYFVFVFMTAGRAFLYGLALAFLSVVFPGEYLAFLFGFLLVAGGIFGLLQYAFVAWAESYADGPLHGDILLLVLVLISFIHPFYIWLTCKRADYSSHTRVTGPSG